MFFQNRSLYRESCFSRFSSFENFRTFAISQLYFTHTTKIRQEKVKVWLLLNVRNFKLLWGDDVAVHNDAWKTLVSSLEFIFNFLPPLFSLSFSIIFVFIVIVIIILLLLFFSVIVLSWGWIRYFVISLTLSEASSWTQWPQRGNTCIWNLPLKEYRRVSIIKKNCHSNKKILYHIN